MKKTVTIVIASTLCVSGCYNQALLKAAGFDLPKSTYSLSDLSDSGVTSYTHLVKSVEKKVVNDDLGSYYFETTNDGGVYSVVLYKEDQASLRYITSTAYGLMEPVYVYKKNTEIDVDWEASQKKYNFLTKILGLKLLPFEQSKNYHMLIGLMAKANAVSFSQMKQGDLFAVTVNGLSKSSRNEMGIYNPDYYDLILSNIKGKFDYVVNSGTYGATNSYYTTLKSRLYFEAMPPEQKALMPINNESALKYDAISAKLAGNYSIYFTPVDYYKSLVKGGDMKILSSGCSFSYPATMRDTLRLGSAHDTYYGNTNFMATMEKSTGKLDKARNNFLENIKKYTQNGVDLDQVCLRGLRALDVAGAIESKRLK